MLLIDKVRILLDNPSEADMEKAYVILDSAKDTILDYIGREELPDRLNSVVVQLAVIMYNQQGAEGETARSQGGVSQSFLNDLPPLMKKRLDSYPRKVGVINAPDTELNE